jgi:hypothetical protein
VKESSILGVTDARVPSASDSTVSSFLLFKSGFLAF